MLSNNISKHDRELIEKFVDVFIAHAGKGYALDVPESMKVGETDEDGWAEWKPVDKLTIRSIENEIGHPLPPLFCAYLMYKCLLMTDFIVRLPQTLSNDPLREFTCYLELLKANDSFFSLNGLIPFAFDGNDVGYVCFDTKYSNNNDYRIVIVDSTKINQEGYTGDEAWSNFEALLKLIMKDLASYD